MLKRFREIIRRSNGMILVTGPTGSGKTTTLYSALAEINTIDQKIITVEDPVEYRLPGINQVQVNEKIDLTFTRVLRSALRQDPDVILVGEMRDAETAQIGLRAAMTGHLVFSTLHTRDAAGTLFRLVDMARRATWWPPRCRRSSRSGCCGPCAGVAANRTFPRRKKPSGCRQKA